MFLLEEKFRYFLLLGKEAIRFRDRNIRQLQMMRDQFVLFVYFGSVIRRQGISQESHKLIGSARFSTLKPLKTKASTTEPTKREVKRIGSDHASHPGDWVAVARLAVCDVVD